MKMEAVSNTTYDNYNELAPVLSLFSNTSTLTSEHKLLSLETLQQSLDLKEMMTNFATLVATFIRPLNIRFQSAFGFYNSAKIQKKHFSKSFNLTSSDNSSRLGTITYQSESEFTMDENNLLTELHSLLQPNLKHALKVSELNSMVYKDHLTNIGNRAYYESTIYHAIEQSNRTNLGLTLMVLDINNFKPINDSYGHSKGDEVLKAFADVLNKSIRSSDMVFRLGGDEFVIILQPAEACSIKKVQQRIEQQIQKNVLLKQINFSTSIGHKTWEAGISAKELFEQADQNLYQNKALGKI